jgi:hypothetical protein
MHVFARTLTPTFEARLLVDTQESPFSVDSAFGIPTYFRFSGSVLDARTITVK